MNKLGKVAGINLLILLFYMIWIYFSNSGTEDAQLGILIMAAFCIGVHVFIDFAIGIYFFQVGDKEMSRAFMLSSALVLLIGFSSCLGSAFL